MSLTSGPAQRHLAEYIARQTRSGISQITTMDILCELASFHLSGFINHYDRNSRGEASETASETATETATETEDQICHMLSQEHRDPFKMPIKPFLYTTLMSNLVLLSRGRNMSQSEFQELNSNLSALGSYLENHISANFCCPFCGGVLVPSADKYQPVYDLICLNVDYHLQHGFTFIFQVKTSSQHSETFMFSRRERTLLTPATKYALMLHETSDFRPLEEKMAIPGYILISYTHRIVGHQRIITIDPMKSCVIAPNFSAASREDYYYKPLHNPEAANRHKIMLRWNCELMYEFDITKMCRESELIFPLKAYDAREIIQNPYKSRLDYFKIDVNNINILTDITERCIENPSNDRRCTGAEPNNASAVDRHKRMAEYFDSGASRHRRRNTTNVQYNPYAATRTWSFGSSRPPTGPQIPPAPVPPASQPSIFGSQSRLSFIPPPALSQPCFSFIPPPAPHLSMFGSDSFSTLDHNPSETITISA